METRTEHRHGGPLERGRAHLRKFDEEGYRAAAASFTEALELEPECAEVLHRARRMHPGDGLVSSAALGRMEPG